MTCSSVVPSQRLQTLRNRLLQYGYPEGHRSCQKTCSGMGSSPWAAAPARSLLLHGLCTDCTFKHIHLAGHAAGHGLQCGCSVLLEENVLPHWLQGISALAPGVFPSSPSLTWVSAELFLSFFLQKPPCQSLLCQNLAT